MTHFQERFRRPSPHQKLIMCCNCAAYDTGASLGEMFLKFVCVKNLIVQLPLLNFQ